MASSRPSDTEKSIVTLVTQSLNRIRVAANPFEHQTEFSKILSCVKYTKYKNTIYTKYDARAWGELDEYQRTEFNTFSYSKEEAIYILYGSFLLFGGIHDWHWTVQELNTKVVRWLRWNRIADMFVKLSYIAKWKPSLRRHLVNTRTFFNRLTSDWRRSLSESGLEPTKVTHSAVAKITMSFILFDWEFETCKGKGYDIIFNKMFLVGSYKIFHRGNVCQLWLFIETWALGNTYQFVFKNIILFYLESKILSYICACFLDNRPVWWTGNVLKGSWRKRWEGEGVSTMFQEWGAMALLSRVWIRSKLSLSTEWKWRMPLAKTTPRFLRKDGLKRFVHFYKNDSSLLLLLVVRFYHVESLQIVTK